MKKNHKKFNAMKIKLTCLILLFTTMTLLSNAQMIKKGMVDIGINGSYLNKYQLSDKFKTVSGPTSLSIGYAYSDKGVVGFDIGYLSVTTPSETIEIEDENQNITEVTFHGKGSEVFFLLKSDYYWVNKNSFALYSSTAVGYGSETIGVVFESEDEGDVMISQELGGLEYQISPIAVRGAISKHIGAHLELGYGIKGILCGGIDFRF